MRYLRGVAVLAVAAVAMTAFISSASATVLTSPLGTSYTGSLGAASEGHITFHGPSGSGIKLDCNSALEAKVEQHGEAATVKAALTSITFVTCTNGWTVSTKALGSLEIHTREASANGNGTVTSTGTTMTFSNTNLGFTCNTLTKDTDLGTLTGSKVTGSTATLDLSATTPIESFGSSIFCGSSWTWTGSYKINTPDYLDVD